MISRLLTSSIYAYSPVTACVWWNGAQLKMWNRYIFIPSCLFITSPWTQISPRYITVQSDTLCCILWIYIVGDKMGRIYHMRRKALFWKNKKNHWDSVNFLNDFRKDWTFIWLQLSCKVSWGCLLEIYFSTCSNCSNAAIFKNMWHGWLSKY